MKNILTILFLIITISCEKDTYDNRDEIVGSYICNLEFYSWTIDDTSSNTKTTTDTLLVFKYGDQKIQIGDDVFALDSNWKYFEHQGGTTSINVQFFPDSDSTHYKRSFGGLGGGSVYDYKGIKINN